MRARPLLILVVAMALAASTAVAATAAATAPPGPASAPRASTVTGLPAGVPAAARQAEPTLPQPKGWPFEESFSRTSGTGRLGGGATYWTDFVYDDHGAVGVETSQTSSLAPTIGTYTYPPGPAHGNGADIFRAAVGLDAAASYWRVDWTTLTDPRVPIAEWGLDIDGVATPVRAWPAGAGVRSGGLDRALIVSSRGARLVDASGRPLAVLPVTVDRDARSFVVRVPRTVLPVSNTWAVRLASGMADATGTRFAPVPPSRGAIPGEPAVYNVSFRTAQQEAASCGKCTPLDLRGIDHGAQTLNANLWNETAQATTLAQRGDISAFTLAVKWSDLAVQRATPEPLVYGASTRWYVTTLHPGEGVVPSDVGPRTSTGGDFKPNYLARIQPYSVHVPAAYRPGHAMPLTWVLHSLGVNHNQYTALSPKFLDQLCDGRGSICATTLGFGADGWYFNEAEVDFWQVWRDLASTYTLDPTRTVLSGYSMGGYGSYRLGLTYPDLFAASMPIAGPSVCGARLYGKAVGYATPGRCTNDSDTHPLIGNARWLPYLIADGAADQLVPFPGVLQQMHQFDLNGLRYTLWAYPAEDHILYSLQDGFSSQVAALGSPVVMRDPGSIRYAWYPDAADPAYRLGPTGIYWLRGLVPRDRTPGKIARIDATSGALPMPPHQVVKGGYVDAPGDPTPALVRTSTWKETGPAPAPTRRLKVKLAVVAAVTVDLGRAGFGNGPVDVTLISDGPARVTLVRPDGSTRVVHLGQGTTNLTLS